MTADDTPTKQADVATQTDATSDIDDTIDRSSRVQELEAIQMSLLELLFELVKDRADSVGKDEYLRLLERRNRQLSERLTDAERENKHLALAIKMYKAQSDAAQKTPESSPDGYESGLADQMPQVHHSHKRSLEEMQSENEDSPAAPPAKLPKPTKERVIVCIPCFRKGRRCDAGEPCGSCLKNRSKCQRAKCANYKAGTCSAANCTRVHEDDKQKYKNTVYSGHVSKKGMVNAAKKAYG